MSNCFLPADILLPPASVPLDPWASIAVDQFTSQPEYWQKAEARAAGAAQHPCTSFCRKPIWARPGSRNGWRRSVQP